MDLTIPYTFYPRVLPHWIAWVLFASALAGGAITGLGVGRARGWVRGLAAGVVVGASALFVTVIASMVITFFLHDQ